MVGTTKYTIERITEALRVSGNDSLVVEDIDRQLKVSDIIRGSSPLWMIHVFLSKK